MRRSDKSQWWTNCGKQIVWLKSVEAVVTESDGWPTLSLKNNVPCPNWETIPGEKSRDAQLVQSFVPLVTPVGINSGIEVIIIFPA